MAALFESGVTFGEKSWHGLENNLLSTDERRYSVAGTMAAAGMDWTVTKLPLVVAPGHGDLSGTAADGVFGVFRTDRWECLAAAGADYQCLQNADIFAQFQPFLDCRELSFESAGSLDGGKRVYVQARLACENINVGNGDGRDEVSPYLLIASSHDGSLATRVGFTPIRVVCNNTLSAACNSGRSQLLKVKHTRGQRDAISAIMETVDLARRQFVANCEQYRKLANMPIDRDTLASYVKQVLGIDPLERDRSKFSSRLMNQYDRVINLAVYGKGNPGRLADVTLWNAYNGVTEWTSHYRQKSADDRNKSVWFGASAATNSKALELALTLAG